jgi:hypothetical protein
MTKNPKDELEQACAEIALLKSDRKELFNIKPTKIIFVGEPA